MKKLFTLLAVIGLVFTLAACKECVPITEYVDKIVEVPGETIYVEVPGEKEIVIKREEVPGPTVYVEVYVPESATVANTRLYKPGVYFNSTEIGSNGVHSFTVVIVDSYGHIAGVLFDETKTTSEFLIDDDNNLYVYVEGDGKSIPNTYRLIDAEVAIDDYPTAIDAITADDLVVGIHQAQIASLSEIEANESRQIRGGEWVEQTQILADRIVTDQTTYGILTSVSGDAVTTTNVEGFYLTNVDIYLDLVQGILNGEANLSEDDTLETTPINGLYTPGMYFASTERLVGSSVNYNISFVAVDEYGRIAGVYTDATFASEVEGGHSTKWILGELGYPMAGGWDSQARAYGEAVVKNQGTEMFNYYQTKDYENEVEIPVYDNGIFLHNLDDDGERYHHIYTDQISGCTVGMEGMVTATERAINKAIDWNLTDGTYFVKGVGEEKHAVMYVNIEDNAIESIFLDNTQPTEIAQVFRNSEYFNVFVYTKYWEDTAGENKETAVLVYFDGDDYRSLNDMEFGEDELEKDDKVSFEVGEEERLEPVTGNTSKQILKERYGNGALSSSWHIQGNEFSSTFVGSTSPYIINLTDGEYTDSITGVTIKVDNYQQLLVEALLNASSADAVKYSLIDDVDVANGSAKLADGVYFSSLETDEHGNQYLAFMYVKDNIIQSIVFDAVLDRDDLTTTKNSLGDAYGLASVSTIGEDGAEWYVQAATYAEYVLDNQSAIIQPIESGYDYTANDEFGNANFADTVTGVSITKATFENLTIDLIQQALKARVLEEANIILDGINDSDDLDLGVMIGSIDETYSTNINLSRKIGSLSTTSFDVSWESTDDDIIDVSSNDLVFKAGDVDVNTECTITAVLEYDNEEIASRDITFTVVTPAAGNNLIFEKYIKDNELDGLIAVEGYNMPLIGTEFIILEAGLPTSNNGFFVTLDGEDTKIDNINDLPDGNHVITMKGQYEEDTFVTETFNVTILTIEEALEEVKGTVKAANILDNGEVTLEEFTLSTESSVIGINVSWELDEDSEDVATIDENILTIKRTYRYEKIGLEATIETDPIKVLPYDSSTVIYDFRAVPVDVKLANSRINDVLKDVNLGVRYFDTSETIIIEDIDNVINEFDSLEQAQMTIEWSTDNEAVRVNGLDDLVVDALFEGDVTIELEILLDIDSSTELTFTKLFDITFFK
ncbi:hypothetical protein KHQ82_06910 [Mycoplasmatota bacterium]|nr:hypothetical protein KHQ82_06910 [Mycoplasmatota bacterium]